ncbi:hypothetical protein MEX01_45640 [Methylorubrum extorquens]|nr:hypothetical protein MEX01_45640 [Methylorubrum extorquens]
MYAGPKPIPSSFILTAVYDRVLHDADLVLVPTTPQSAHDLPEAAERDRNAFAGQTLKMILNTAAFDLTGQPSISVWCTTPGSLRSARCSPAGSSIKAPYFAQP